MTRKTRKLIISLAVLVALLGAVFWIRSAGKDPEIESLPDQAVESIYLTDSVPELLRSLSVQNSDGEMSVISMDGVSWLVKDAPEGYKAKDLLLRSLISNLSVIRGELIDENPEDSGAYGLNPPSATVTMADNAGTETKILFGDSNPAGSGRYAAVAGQSRVYLVPATQANKAFWSLKDIREDRLPELDLEAITSIAIRTDGEVFQAIPSAGELDPYRPLKSIMDIVEPWKGRHLAEDHLIQQTLSSSPPPSRISGFPTTQPGDPLSLGLGPTADRILIESAEGGRYNMEIGIPDGEGRRYARESSYGDVVFLVDEADLRLLDLDPYKHTNQFVFLAGIDRVSEIRIEGGGFPRVLSIEKLGDPEDDSDDVFRIDGIELSERDFKDAYQLVIGLLYEGVARKRETEADPEYRIRYTHVNPEVPPKTVSFRPYDKTYYVAEVEGEVDGFIIGRYQIRNMLDALTEAIGAGP